LNDMYNELLRYKREHGHCRVPDGDPNHPKLGEWVARQLVRITASRAHESSILNGKAKLDKIGFVWDAREENWHRTDYLLAEYR
jgi:hypothetical protein